MTANPLFESTEAPAGAPILALDAGFTATGVVAAVVELLALPVEWVTPLAVKKAATGHNAGSKEQVEAAVLAR